MLYISDIDGTLLRNDATLADDVLRQLNELLDRGVAFTLASARSVVSMQQVLPGLRLRLPVIEFHGAFLTDFHTGRHLVVNSMEPALCAQVHAYIRRAGHQPFISTFDGTADRLHHEMIVNEGMRLYLDGRIRSGDRRVRPAAPATGALAEQVVCFTVIGERQMLEVLHQELQAAFGPLLAQHLFLDSYSGWSWLTIHDCRASKDQAITTLKRFVGLESSPVTVFGDNTNDLSMFAAAERAIAVGNALDEVKLMAHLVIGTNEEASVVRFVAAECGDLGADEGGC